MHKGFLTVACFLGAAAVALGAFGAHGLKAYASPQMLITYETAVRYHFYHVFALALTGVLYQSFPFKTLRIAGKLIIAGMILFSGSLYLLTFLSIAGMNQFNWLGAITPVGGLLLVAGWFLLGWSMLRYKA